MKNKKKVMLAAVVATTMALGLTSAYALALENRENKADLQNYKVKSDGERRNPFEKLVEDGVISQETYDNMAEYMKNNMEDKNEITRRAGQEDIFTQLLENNIISQEQYEAMKEDMPTREAGEKMKGDMPVREAGEKFKDGSAERKSPFEDLVDEGVMDETTIANIQAYMEANKPLRGESQAKPEGGAKEQIDLFAQLLEDNVITQAQYDAIKEKMPTMSKDKDFFERYVTAGVIDETTYKAINTFLEANRPAASSLKEAKDGKKDFLVEFRENGIITQEEYEALQNAMSQGITQK